MARVVKKNGLVLGGALLLTLGISAWLGMDNESEVADVVEVVKQASAKQNARPRSAEPALTLPVLAEERANAENKRRAADIFKPHAWFVAPSPTHAGPVVAAPPAPPPLPFTYLGTVEDGGRTVVFLAKEQKLYTVHKGEVFAGQYRLEDESKGRIEIVYLPLNAKQVLVIKGAS